jgi:hypothetical protein
VADAGAGRARGSSHEARERGQGRAVLSDRGSASRGNFRASSIPPRARLIRQGLWRIGTSRACSGRRTRPCAKLGAPHGTQKARAAQPAAGAAALTPDQLPGCAAARLRLASVSTRDTRDSLRH